LSKKEEEWFVEFIAYWKVKNIDFARLVLKKHDIELSNLLLLDKIAIWKIKIWTEIESGLAKSLKDKWYIEINWKRKICNFSQKFANNIWTSWKRHKLIKYTKTQEEAEIINYLREKKKWKTNDFLQIFEDKKYTYDMVYNIIRRLKKKSIIKKEWKDCWIIIDSVEQRNNSNLDSTPTATLS